MMIPTRVILATCWLPALMAVAAPPTTKPSSAPPAPPPPPPPGVYPPGPPPPGMLPRGAVPSGTVPPGQIPRGAMPPGATPPPGAFPGASPREGPPINTRSPIAYDLVTVPDDVRVRLEGFQKLYDDGAYADLLEKLNARLVELKRQKEARSVTELARIHMLRGEAYLQQRNQQPAVAAFKDAAAAATTGVGKARPTSFILLIQRSKQFAYTPKGVTGGEGEPIDIVAERDRAMEALLADELDRARPKVSRAPKTVPQVFQMYDATADARTIELGATGGVQQTAMLLGPAAAQARQLVQSAVADMEAEAGFIKNRANTLRKVVAPPPYREQNHHPAGLRDGDRATLDRIAQDCTKVSGLCAALAAAFPEETASWRSISETADRVRTEAEQTRDANYQPQKIKY